VGFSAHFTLLDDLFFVDIGAVKQSRFADSKELATTLKHYEKLYNARIPQKMLGHRPPQGALRQWRKDCPDLFVKNIYNLTGLDMCCVVCSFLGEKVALNSNYYK